MTTSTRRLHVGQFGHIKDKIPRPSTPTVDELRDQHRTAVEVALVDVPASSAAKEKGACFSPAKYAAGTTRKKANVEVLSAFVIDLDGVTAEAVDDVIGRLAGLCCWAFTTWGSGWSKGKLPAAWRIVVPLAVDVEAAIWPDVWRLLTDRFAPSNDPSTKNADRLHYGPRAPRRVPGADGEAVDNAPPSWREQDGALFDPSGFIEAARVLVAEREQKRLADEAERERRKTAREQARAVDVAFDPESAERGAVLAEVAAAERAHRYAHRALDGECERIRGAQRGADWHPSLNRAGYWIGTLLGGLSKAGLLDVLTKDEARGRLLEAAGDVIVAGDRSYDAPEAERVIDGGLDAGILKPRALPDFDGDEDAMTDPRDDDGCDLGDDRDDGEGAAWPLPVPLDGHGELPAFPLGALPHVLREWVEATATALQVPNDLAAFCALGALAACVQGRLEAEVWPGWIEVLGLYGEVLLSSGNRKSAGFRSAVAPLAEIEAEKARELAGEIKDARALRRVAEKRLERAEKNAAASDAGPNSEADVCAAVQALDAAAVPVVPRWIIDDSTPEAMVFALRDQGGAIALLSAEGDGLVTSMGRYSEEANLGPLLAGHAGDTYRRDRVKEGQSIVIPKVTMTVLLAVQPCTLAALAPHAGRGLPARFLYSLPNDVLGHRLDRTAAVPPRVAARYREIIRHLANIPAEHDDAGMLVPRTIHFSDGARQILEDYHHEIEPRLAGDLEPIQAWASKLRGSLVRIAALSHLVDAEDHGASPVSEEAMQRTMLLADYLIAHSVAAHALMHASGPQVDASTILRAVRRAGLFTATERDLLRLCRGLDRDRRDEAIEVLLERGWFRKTAVRHPSSGGPPTVTFTVYPGTSAADPDRLSRLSLPPSVSTVTDPRASVPFVPTPSEKSAADTLSVALVPSVPSSPEPVAESLSRSIPVRTTPPGQTGQTLPASEGDLRDTFLQGQP